MKTTMKIFAALALTVAMVLAATNASAQNATDPTADILTADNFPDANFRAALQTLATEKWGDKDGKLTTAEAAAMTEMLNVSRKSIARLDGIEYFTGLTGLECSSNALTALDVSKNTALTQLVCGMNQIAALDVSKNTALTMLLCDRNQITTLDVSKNTALTQLLCAINQITALDVSKNTALEMLFCESNQLTTLDVSKNTALTVLHCPGNPGDGAGKFPVKVWPSFGTPPKTFSTAEWEYVGKTITPVYSE